MQIPQFLFFTANKGSDYNLINKYIVNGVFLSLHGLDWLNFDRKYVLRCLIPFKAFLPNFPALEMVSFG
jgi:hypothetical protein